MTFTYLENYEENALNRQIEFFKGLINWEKLLTIYAQDSQEIEDVLNEFHEKLNVQFGEGETLDVYGKIFQVARGNLSDDEYRNLILTAYVEFQKSGEIETIISAYMSLTLATKISLIEYFPATFITNAEVGDSEDITAASTIREAMENIKAAGVEMDLTVSVDSGAFSFISIGDEPNPALGFTSLTGLATTDPFIMLSESGDTLITESGDIMETEEITTGTAVGGEWGSLLENITFFFDMITESGDTMITESGDTLITEGGF